MIDLNTVKVLYKYRTFESKFDRRLLWLNELFFAKKHMLNDPFDLGLEPDYSQTTKDQWCKVALRSINSNQVLSDNQRVKLLKEEIIKIDNGTSDLQKNHKEAIFGNARNENKEFKEGKINKMCILSLVADNPTNSLMWAHYSSSHQGFCIGYNATELFNYLTTLKDQHEFTQLAVKYKDYYPKVNPLTSTEFYLDLLYTKSIEWDYEDEVRIINETTHPNHNNGFAIYYPNKLVRDITLGLYCSEENRNMVVNRINEMNSLHNLSIKLYQITKEDYSYEFKRKDISELLS